MTNTQLIPVSEIAISGELTKTANARELHAFLQVGKDFSTWLKDRIEQYGFVENQDFVCSPILGSEGRGGHNRKDYHLTLEMAKELSMVERNQKGKEARQYFIQCEKRLRTPDLSNEVERLLVIQDMAAKQLLLIQENQKITGQRDEAIRTKAEIGSRREATAMATASAKSKEVQRLKEELGRNQAHATIKVVEKMTGDKFAWTLLKRYCQTNSLSPRKVVDEQYGNVNAWPAIAWREVYGIDLETLFPNKEF